VDVSEYVAYDAVGIAELIRSGQVSAAEVEAAARGAIAAVNPELNGLVGPLFERPLAYDASGPLAGVPFLLKDLVCHAGGVTHECGSRLCRGWTPPHDTDLAARFRGAGLAVLGRTATPEFGVNVTTESVVNGPTRNPWNTGRSPGGSSGGSAALVAAGAVPLAHANDGAGSIRIPASCCGLVGLKPTRGRVPPGPDAAEPLMGFAIELGVSRTVRDTAALLDAVQGSGVGDKYEIRPPARPYAEEVGADPGSLRIALQTAPPSGAAVDRECVGAAERIATELEGLGHRVSTGAPVIAASEYRRALTILYAACTAAWVEAVGAICGSAPGPDTLEAATWATLEAGRRYSATELLWAESVCNTISRAVGAFFEEHDILLSPTLAAPPAPLGTIDQNDPRRDGEEWLEFVFHTVAPFSSLYNLSGCPAVSLPLCESSTGLPIGIQLGARYGREDTLIRLASQLEAALPWRERRPGVFAGS